MTSHFPNHAFLCSTKIVLLQKENQYIVGTADEVVTAENLKAAYDINVKIINAVNDGEAVKACVPLMKRAMPLGA
jgi:iron complex transport system ATP-binding protein